MGNPPRNNPVSNMGGYTFQAPSSSGATPFSSTLGAIAVAVGMGLAGAYMLDLHGHACEGCGRRWRHFGAFNLGDEKSHTCSRCGEVQWWKCGVPHVLRGSQFSPAPNRPQGGLPIAPAHAQLGTPSPPRLEPSLVPPPRALPLPPRKTPR